MVVTRTSQDGDRPSRRLDSDGEDEDEDTPKVCKKMLDNSLKPMTNDAFL